MRRWVGVGAALAALAAAVLAMVVCVPAGRSAWCGGQSLDEGLHLRAPFARLDLYPPQEQRLSVEHAVTSREGASQTVTVTLTYRWDPARLAATAERHYLEAIELNPSSGIARANLASLYAQQGRHDQALLWYTRALRLLLESDPSNAGLLGNLAAALQMQGKPEEAAQTMRRATTARPDDAPLRFNYGATLAGLGRDGEALAQFEEAVRLGLPGPRVVAARAKVLVRLAREAEARDVLADGARRFPADREISELLGLLREPLSRSAFRVAGSA